MIDKMRKGYQPRHDILNIVLYGCNPIISITQKPTETLSMIIYGEKTLMIGS